MKKKLFIKFLFAVLPLVLITCLYIYADPFMVVGKYPDLKSSKRKHLELNEDYVNTEYLLKHYQERKFNSFVFGSSRAALFYGDHLDRLFDNDSTYNYSVALESLFGEERKLELLANLRIPIKNVLVTIDAHLLSVTTNSKGHLFIKHPLVSHESWTDFQLVNYKDVFDFDFLSAYYELQKRGASKEPQNPYLVEETFIARNADSFYASRVKDLAPRPAIQQFESPVIHQEQLEMLGKMAAIFKQENTNYFILIHPLYDQKKMAPRDVELLDSIFDKKRVFDFSGKNELTENARNYYEHDHYRKFIADRIVDSMYQRLHAN